MGPEYRWRLRRRGAVALGGAGGDDDLGELTFAAVHERTNRLAAALVDKGIAEGDSVALDSYELICELIRRPISLWPIE